MSQEMNILRCSSCKTYQVNMVKKAKKWQCKICNFKQIFRRVYFKGSGKDCRVFVQKLNLTREQENHQDSSFGGYHNTDDNSIDKSPEPKRIKISENKWTKYLDSAEEINFNNFNVNKEETMFECSEIEYTNINDDSSCENESNQTHDYNSEEEHKNIALQHREDISQTDNNGHDNVHKKESTTEPGNNTKSIFDDNEDFDLTIDF